MPSNDFQSIPINKKPDVIFSLFEKGDRFISTKVLREEAEQNVRGREPNLMTHLQIGT